MIYFRCYSCWKSLGYSGPRDYMICTICDTKLFVGNLKQGIIYGDILNLPEHKLLLQRLHEQLSKDKSIYRGKIEVIAGENIRHRPDSIYYRCGKMLTNQPLIYEVEICNSISTENTISRCKLFSATAHNLFSKFYLVVPKDCDGKSGKELAEKILRENKIDLESVEIMAIQL